MNLLEQYRVSPEKRSEEKSLLSRYREKPQQQAIPSQSQISKQEFPIDEFNEEKEIERNIARGTSRIGETILGLPGDLYEFARGIFGEPTSKAITGFAGRFLPTSQQLRETSEELTGGFTKPTSELEEKSDEILQDISSFMTPGSGKYNFVRNIGVPIVANLAKEGVKYAGADKMGDAAKIGTMITLDLLSHKGGGAKKFAGDLFNQSESLIPEGAVMKSKRFDTSLNSLEKTLESGGSRPSTEKALKKISEIKSKMKNGEIEVKELADFRKSINEIKSELGGFEIQLPKAIKKKAIANLDLVKREVIDALHEYGDKFNPEFSRLNKSANEAYAAYESSDKIASFLKKTLKNSIKNPGVKTILGLGGVTLLPQGVTLGKIAAGGALPALAGYEGYKILHQVIQSPTLRRFYGNILKGAATGNASQVIKNSKALEKELDKQKVILGGGVIRKSPPPPPINSLSNQEILEMHPELLE